MAYARPVSILVIVVISESESGRNSAGRRVKKYYHVVSGPL